MIEYDYPDLKPLTSGASFSLVFQTLYYAHLLRYSTPDMLKALTGSVKIATKKKLDYLCEQGYLVKKLNCFVSTSKTLDLLIKQGYKRELLPPPAEGEGAEIYNSLQITKLIQQENYRHILYPHFDYLIPDALVIWQPEEHRCKLQFIEIEAPKPKWAEYLQDKRRKYERLAQDEQVYKYWQIMSQHLGLRCPAMKDFKFAVKIIKLEG